MPYMFGDIFKNMMLPQRRNEDEFQIPFLGKYYFQ